MIASLALLLVAMQGSAAPLRPAAAAVIADSTPAAATAAEDRGFAARLARGDSLAFAGNLDAAERVYRSVANDQSDAGEYARDAMWRLAMAYYLDDAAVETARTLDRLAAAAREFGDPQTELEASYESARFHAAMRDTRTTMDRVARVRSLMQSPVIPDSVKADYAARLRTGAR